MLSHRNLLFTAKTSGILRQSGPADRIYGVLPMSHIVGYSILLIATLMHGGTLYVVAKADPAALAHAIAEEGITSLFGVPATYQRLLEHKAVKGLQRLERGRLRVMAVAGAPLDLDLKKRIEDEFGIPLPSATTAAAKPSEQPRTESCDIAQLSSPHQPRRFALAIGSSPSFAIVHAKCRLIRAPPERNVSRHCRTRSLP
jgi:acyl-CoA synthetase (AMP-forming)/AMP-acid ligase II